ncbi:MAG TPA: amino acid adenylation domain-containing protein [Pyrinomonadaceae bacterium]|jgi:amino acid adenylation domain-containing protein|nr:amino acid adenylation domain-containing protein [Pyrinomonadaceae bacterium]
MSSRLASTLASITPAQTANPRLPTSSEAARLPLRNIAKQLDLNCVPQLINLRAAETPNAPALSTGSETMTYAELNGRANQLAHYLISLGLNEGNSDSLVALCIDRSLPGVVCALGVLKAGAAYLPLDPGYPLERLSFMLNDAQPQVLITTTKMAAQIPAGNWQVIAFDRLAELECAIDEFAELPTSPLKVDIAPQQLAYVIYTSGSTGRPKGVEITHANLMNLVTWHQRAFEITREDRASLLAGVGFDAAVWETWPYLTAGASLHLPDEPTRLSPDQLRDWLVAEQITVSFLPTALAERVMRLEWPEHTALRTLLVGAERLRQFPSDELPFDVVNNYGPTECTVVATSGIVPREAFSNALPTIGRPITNTDVYILDENMQQVPVHAAGEIYIGGAGVARGYLKRPDLTAEKFVRNPFSRDRDARLYRTGDLARYLANGEIAYLGRIDEQIKILGHRIEPNEIVAVLDRHPAIAASRVIAHGNTCSEQRLVAYVVAASEIQPSTADLRSFLENELPHYMVPSVFVQLESFPLTQNGKVDRAALPAPDVENTLRDDQFTAARTPLEERLAVMLSSLLGLEQVSVHDNFFMLGGHSLLGTQLISQIRGAFGVELALRTLFESPTIEQLSLEIERLLMARVDAMSEEEVLQLLV